MLLTYSMEFMDAQRRQSEADAPAFHDGSGRPAGTRPGFCIPSAPDEAAAKNLADAYAERDAHLRDAWMGVPPAASAAGKDAACDASAGEQAGEDEVAKAYADYNKHLTEAWKHAR
jgi:hypothetical protein